MKLPGHRPGASRKGNFIFIVPLGPTRAGAYGAPAGQYPRSPSVKINFFTPSQFKKHKRVGRFFWKNLEAKPLDFELA
jgi:hypothetical protein